MRDIGHFIAGKPVTGTSGKFGNVYNPAAGEVTARVALADAAEVDKAVAAAVSAWPAWAATPPLRRARVMFKLTELLERAHPGGVFAIWAHSGDWGEISAVDPRLARLPKPGLVRLRDTWLGRLAVGMPGTPPTMEELADGFLYLGAAASQTQSRPPDSVYADRAYLLELLRRDRIQGGFNRVELRRLRETVRARDRGVARLGRGGVKAMG